MSGERDLIKLLQAMSPELNANEYVFATFADAQYGDHAHLGPVAMAIEGEGLTLVIPRSLADAENLGYDSTFKCITLKVHSSLHAVGLTAAFASKLADHGISANVIAGFYHDHIFVASIDAERAMAALDEFN